MTAEQLLGGIGFPGRAVVLDLEHNSFPTLFRTTFRTHHYGLANWDQRIGRQDGDLVLLVVTPHASSIAAALSLANLVTSYQLGDLVIIANRVQDDADLTRIMRALQFPAQTFVVPEDSSVWAADRAGRSVLDEAPDGPACAALGAVVTAVRTIARSTMRRERREAPVGDDNAGGSV